MRMYLQFRTFIVASTPDVQVNVIDIMEALKQSLAQAGVKND